MLLIIREIQKTNPFRRNKKTKQPRFYDIFGNVAEWVWDPHDKYPSQAIDPKGPELQKR